MAPRGTPPFRRRTRSVAKDNPWESTPSGGASDELLSAWGRDENVFMLTPADIASATWAEAKTIEETSPSLITLGIPSVDSVVNTIFGKRLTVVLGRPSEGKSLLLYQWARQECQAIVDRSQKRNGYWPDDGEYVLFVGLEEDAIDVSSMVRGDMISRADVAAGRRTPKELRESGSRALDWPLYVLSDQRRDVWGSKFNDSTLLAEAIWEEIMAMYRRTGKKPTLILIDYLQIMQATGRGGQDPREAVAQNARGCRAMARQLGVPVVLASQARRIVDSGGRLGHPPIPDTGDSEWSAVAEQSADVLLSVTRPYRWPAHLLSQLGMEFAPRPSDPDRKFAITPNLVLLQLLKQKGAVGRARFMLRHIEATGDLVAASDTRGFY